MFVQAFCCQRKSDKLHTFESSDYFNPHSDSTHFVTLNKFTPTSPSWLCLEFVCMFLCICSRRDSRYFSGFDYETSAKCTQRALVMKCNVSTFSLIIFHTQRGIWSSSRLMCSVKRLQKIQNKALYLLQAQVIQKLREA